MKKYNITQIDEHIQWLMRFMQDEYPNNYEIVISPTFAQVRNTQTEMTFVRDDMKPENIHISEEMQKRLESMTLKDMFFGNFGMKEDGKPDEPPTGK